MKKLLIIIPILLILSGCSLFQKCIQSHKEMVHHDFYMQMLPLYNGATHTTTFMYIPHPAYDSEEDICDQYETNK